MRRGLVPAACAALVVAVAGCESYYVADADREVASVLEEFRPGVEEPRPAAFRQAGEKLGLLPAGASEQEEVTSASGGQVAETPGQTEAGAPGLQPDAATSSEVPGVPEDAAAPADPSSTPAPGAVAGDVSSEKYEDFTIVTPGYAGPGVPEAIRRYVATIHQQEEVLPPLEELSPARGPKLSLRDALALAVEQNRQYQGELENRYLEALDLTLQRHNFGPVLFATVSTLFKAGDTVDKTQSSAFSAGVTDRLPTGGQLTIDGAIGLFRNYDTESNADAASYGVSLVQPLLRDAGYTVSHERLTQQQRNVIYEIREFELFRQDFTIDVARAFWNVTLSEHVARNIYESYMGAVDQRRKAAAQLKVGQAKPLDVMRARLDELRRKNSYVDAVERYENALDAFKIRLALPTDDPLTLVAERTFDYTPITVDVEAAIEVALANRLDLANARQKVEDAERGVKLAANALLPELDLTAAWESATEGTGSLGTRTFSDGDYSVGLSLELPVDRKSERNAYRRALIDLERAKRSYSLAADEVKRNVRDVLRELRTADATLNIQAANMAVAKRRLEFSEALFDIGKANNRDIVEARTELVGAQNSYASAVADYKVARLSFMREVGILLIDKRGMWIQ